MNKKDFITMFVSNFMIVILLVEHLCGLELALETMCVWTIIALIVNIHVLYKYAFIKVFVRKDCTK